MSRRPPKKPAADAPPRDRQPILAEVGRTGLRQFGGNVREEWHPKLQGLTAAKVYREMADNDAMTGAFLWAQETLIRQAPWKVERADDSPGARDAEELVRSCLDDMELSWQEQLSEILSMAVFGWSVFEIVFKIRRGPQQDPMLRSKYKDGRIGWRIFGPRAQESLSHWEFDAAGRVLGMWQLAPPDYRLRFIDLRRAVHFRIRAWKNNPEGRSLLRNAYRSWYLLKRIQEIEAIGIQRDLAGIPVILAPAEIMHPKATPDQIEIRAGLEQMVRKIERNEYEGIVFPHGKTADGQDTGYELKLLSSGGTRQIDTNEIAKRYESRILISLLAEMLMLGIDSHGSFALSDSKTNVFAMSLGATLDGIADTMNRTAIPELCELNGIPAELVPRLVHGDIETPELTQMANFVAQLAGAGALKPDAKLERHLRGWAGLPVPEVAATPVPPGPAVPTPGAP